MVKTNSSLKQFKNLVISVGIDDHQSSLEIFGQFGEFVYLYLFIPVTFKL